MNSTQDLGQPVADRKNHHQHKLVGHRDNLSPEALQETRQDRRFRRQSSLSEPRHVSTAVIMALRATIKPRIAAERPATPLVTWRACLMKPAASARGSLTQIRRPDPESDFPGSRAVPTSFFARDDQRRTASIRLSEGTAAEIFAKLITLHIDPFRPREPRAARADFLVVDAVLRTGLLPRRRIAGKSDPRPSWPECSEIRQGGAAGWRSGRPCRGRKMLVAAENPVIICDRMSRSQAGN